MSEPHAALSPPHTRPEQCLWEPGYLHPHHRPWCWLSGLHPKRGPWLGKVKGLTCLPWTQPPTRLGFVPPASESRMGQEGAGQRQVAETLNLPCPGEMLGLLSDLETTILIKIGESSAATKKRCFSFSLSSFLSAQRLMEPAVLGCGVWTHSRLQDGPPPGVAGGPGSALLWGRGHRDPGLIWGHLVRGAAQTHSLVACTWC